ncbi:MAG: hypothetical protein PHV33_06655 [Elusimicrobiales bacterium]|nr:hypothetical protein [Elusimicrobiales bacterium]
MEHKSFFSTHKVLAFVPLLLMGAGVWYYIQGRMPGRQQEASVPANAPIFGGAQPKPAAPSASAPAAALKSDDISTLGAAAARLPEVYDPKAGLDIQGPPEFKSQVTHALKLVWQADRQTFLFIRTNLSVIRNEMQTGFYLENGRSVAALSKDHAFRSLTWCAGIIAHQAWHAAYTQAKKRRKAAQNLPPPPPGEKSERQVEANPMVFDYSGMAAILYVEDKASAFQLDVLKKIGAPARETGPLFRRAPRDFHLSHDGNYAINP